jgi:exocyst complex component 4
MLRSTPFHKENYARLILSVVIQFYQRCSDRFYSIVSSGDLMIDDQQLRTAAKWAQNPDINAVLSELLNAVCIPFSLHS